jgi:hypothetical protein
MVPFDMSDYLSIFLAMLCRGIAGRDVPDGAVPLGWSLL